MKRVKEKVYRSDKILEFENQVAHLHAGDKIFLQRVNGSLISFILSDIFEKFEKSLLVITPDEDSAVQIRDDLVLIVGEDKVRFYDSPYDENIQRVDLTSTMSQSETLQSLLSPRKYIIVTSGGSIVKKIPSKEDFKQRILKIITKSEYDFQKLIQYLEEEKFERKDFVEDYGDFAVRGGIIDVFPFIGENPIRLEFWGNKIESIREFDVLSQRSIRELSTITIIPDITARSDGNYRDFTSLFNYLHDDTIIFFDRPELVKQEINRYFRDNDETIFTFDNILEESKKFPVIFNSFVSESIKQLFTSESRIVDFNSLSQPSFNGSIRLLYEYLLKLSNESYEIFLTSDEESETLRLKELISETAEDSEQASFIKVSSNYEMEPISKIKPQAINPYFLNQTLHSGFICHPSKLAVLTEHEIFGRYKRRDLPKRKRFKGLAKKEIYHLKRGDYVVHADYGIGEFLGLTKIKVGNVEQEVMKLQFLEKDILYVNLNFVNRVQKYSSSESHVPKLSKLGSPEWERTKLKAKRRIKDIARDLITLYAKRKKERGFSFLPDTHWQKELEASFIYEDTIDQATATLDVKRDMESASPMDRLVCGDVGFGKTEVAVRAAFKAVMSGKQVGVLVPTTILAIQHYDTFLNRMNRYATRIENLTRFKSKKEQHRIIEELKKGSIDVIIGTHRLLSKDVKFRDLGLLIIDEEHRFGVSAKEKLRQLKSSVDTLTLTATPIPRTLHFSLIGARDLSIINTPPRNRLPIITEIIPASVGTKTQWRIIRDGILREIHRGGQIYFVHDRVENIEAIAEQLRTHVPEARVHIAHGQMTGRELEKTMLDFHEKKYDVLVCTKIIESGLDIANVNTIIINRADRFGLAELYQLRGRVGRSNVQAYAYLLVPPLDVLPKQTLRRLSAIEEFTELGSGFNLAMRDLEIRGAGNLLGAEQTGFILEMGFEMYEKIVREAVEELKQEEFKSMFQDSHFTQQDINNEPLIEKAETIIEVDIDAYIPDVYIASDTERLDIYRRLYRIVEEKELVSIREELRDRFGEYPEEVENLFQVIEIRILASRMGFLKVTLKENTLLLLLPDESNKKFYGEAGDNAPFQLLIRQIAEGNIKDVQLKQIKKDIALQLKIKTLQKTNERIKEVKKRILDIARMSAVPTI